MKFGKTHKGTNLHWHKNGDEKFTDDPDNLYICLLIVVKSFECKAVASVLCAVMRPLSAFLSPHKGTFPVTQIDFTLSFNFPQA